MAAFDFSSGARGAQAGAALGPYGAAAGFVIGGFIGGHKAKSAKKKLKKKQKRYAAAYKKLIDPKHLSEITQQMLPGQRNVIAQGPGSQLASQISTSLARGGYSGTGLGETGRAVSYMAPEIAAFQSTVPLAERQWEREIDQFHQKALSENIGWMGQPLQKSDPFGSAGGVVDALGQFGSMGGSFAGGGFKNPYLGSGPGAEAPGYWSNLMKTQFGVGGSGRKPLSGYPSMQPTNMASNFANQFGDLNYQWSPQRPIYGY